MKLAYKFAAAFTLALGSVLVLEAVLASEPRVSEQALLRALAFSALAFLAFAFVDLRYVRRPARALTEKIRRAAQGDLEKSLRLVQHDELGELTAEVNAWCERLRAERAEHEARVLQRITALERTRHAERLTATSKLASGIAHELGTPLNVISGRAQLILADAPSGGEIGGNAQIIVEQTKRITQIIRQLLEFARPRKLELTTCDIRALAEQACAQLVRPEEAQNTPLVVESGEPMPVEVDVMQMQQALSHLLRNAVHAARDTGQVQVSFERRHLVPPPEEGSAPAEYVIVTVRDSGRGMDEKTLSRIFEPFFTTKDVGEGTGLGLSRAHGVVREHGGFITVESRLGAGSTFRVHLPSAGPLVSVSA